MGEWLPLPDVAQLLDVSITKVHALLDERALAALRVGERRIRCVPADFIQDGHAVESLKGTIVVLADAGYSVTLAADGRKGRRPSFDRAAPPELAETLYEHFTACLRATGAAVGTGVFGAMMEVELVNDGPVTFHLEEPPASGA